MDKKMVRYAAGGGAISVGICILLYLVLGSFLNGALALIACGVLFAMPGIVIGCAYGLYEALKDKRDGSDDA